MAGSLGGPGAGCGALEWVLQGGRGRGPGHGCDQASHGWSWEALEWVLQSGFVVSGCSQPLLKSNVYMY